MTEVLIAVGGAALVIMGWVLSQIMNNINRLHDRVDEAEKEIVRLQSQGGHDQTVFTSRKRKR